MNKEEIIDTFSEFLKESYYKDLAKAVTKGEKSLKVDFSLLDKFNPQLADTILEKPEETIEILGEAIEQIDLAKKAKKGKIHIRFFSIPQNNHIRIRNIRSKHIGKLLCLDGVVKRASEVRPEVAEIVFECSECGSRMRVIQTEKDKAIKFPARCDCGSRRNFKTIKQTLHDARWISIEEPFEIKSGE